jgi:hypothetical protein
MTFSRATRQKRRDARVLAENEQREADVLAEHLRELSAVREALMEKYQLHVYFVSPSWTIGEIESYAEQYRAAGFNVQVRGLTNALGDTYGMEIVGVLR